MRVIFICRVVNSKSSRALQSSTVAVKHCGTKRIGKFAAFIALVTVKSSDKVPRHFSRKFSRSNTSRRIAVEPPQQKFLFTFAPKAEAIEAFQTERNWEAKLFFFETNQR